MKNYALTFVGVCATLISINSLFGQSCQDLNLPVEPDDSVTFVVGDFVVDADDVPALRITLMNPNGGILHSEDNAIATTSFRINYCPLRGRTLTLMAASLSTGLQCESKVTFKESSIPVIEGRSITVWCDDPLVAGGHIGGSPPMAHVSCMPDRPATITGDWPEVFDCSAPPGSEDNDTAKIIYRMYEAYDKNGNRGTGQDTIVVLRFPQITPENTFCPMNDTIECGELGPVGPFMYVDHDQIVRFVEAFRHPDGSLDFRAADLDPKCGITLSVKTLPFETDCPKTTKVTVEIKQECLGSEFVPNITPPAPGISEIFPGYFSCEFWVMEIDTTPPAILCLLEGPNADGNILTISTNAHDCAAVTTVPPATAHDECHEVIMVKAMVEGFGSVNLTKGADGLWHSNLPVTLPQSNDLVKITYEAFDECHLVGIDSCFLRIKDQTQPIAAANDQVNVSLSGKKVWVEADVFNNGSWDNCDIAHMLVRRTDWQTACIDLCDSITLEYADPRGDVYHPYLPALGEVGEYFQRTLDWLTLDGSPCAELLYYGWHYDLSKYATVECAGTLDQVSYDSLAGTLYGDEILDQIKQIGGGWAKDVAFDCEDNCSIVQVELLVMDYWCNWNKSWSDAYVEDKTPVTPVQELTKDVSITCKTFQDPTYKLGANSVSLQDLAYLAETGDPDAIDFLDVTFGTYEKAWLTSEGDLVDIDGQPILLDLLLHDQDCQCSDILPSGRECTYEPFDVPIKNGVLKVNCPNNYTCEQSVKVNLNDCGLGTVDRTFTVTAGCPEKLMTLVLSQTIHVESNCALDLGMFTLPSDEEITSCGLIFDPDGSGNIGGSAHPDSLANGRPEFVFDDNCRAIGIGYSDKPLQAVPSTNPDDPCYYITRTWCFIDWCAIGEEPAQNWINNPSYAAEVIKYDQKITVICECPCFLQCQGFSDTTIACVDIPMDLDDLDPLFTRPIISTPNPLIDCMDSIYVKNTPNVDACGIGTYTREWILVDPFGRKVDTCVQTINMQPDIVIGARSNKYRGDAEPFNCSDFITTDPLIVNPNGCRLMGDIVITNNSPYAVKDSNDASGDYPVGVHEVIYTISSNCINTFQVIDSITVVDDVIPQVIAFSDPCVFFQEWEDDFHSDPLNPKIRDMLGLRGIDNCAIDTVFLVDLDTIYYPDEATKDSIMYTYYWQALDVWGNLSDIKVATVLISDLCVSTDIMGRIHTEKQEEISQVSVKGFLSDGTEITAVTDESGHFQIAPADGVDVFIKPEKNTDPRDGINTADLIRMRDHMLGLELLENKYRFRAADVNNDQKLSAVDLLQIRRLILNKSEAFSNSDSWRFYNDINGEETILISEDRNFNNVDFTGIKVGDVDYSYFDKQNSGRSAKQMVISVDNKFLEKGEKEELSFYSNDFTDVDGFQLTIQFDHNKLKLEEFVFTGDLGISEEHISTQEKDDGFILVSWHHPTGDVSPKVVNLFNLVFSSIDEVELSQVVAVNSRRISAESYNHAGEAMAVALEFESGQSGAQYHLLQNRPNPFVHETVIEFSLPESMTARVTLFDVTGKTIKKVERQFEKGLNSISFDRADLRETGIFYYKLEAGEFTATKKLIVMD